MLSLRTIPFNLTRCNNIHTTLLISRSIRHSAAMSTISQAIIDDHRELEQYYNEVVNNANNRDHQQRFGNQFIWELARHSVGEELVLYPAMEKHLGAEGKEMADSDRKEHHSVCTAELPNDFPLSVSMAHVTSNTGQTDAQRVSRDECL